MYIDERQKLQQLFQFDFWCSRRLADIFMEHAPFKEQSACVAFQSHIINAQKIWYSRVVEYSADAGLDIWTEYDVQDLKPKAKKAAQMWIDLVGDHDVNLDAIIEYNNSKGMEYRNSIWQICNHLIIHGQHHRAQIAIFLRNSNIEPPMIDFINYARMDEVQKMII
ncbi:MAG: hypothetical protein EA359_15910 [Balneolaceae bacterium]|nr:MAG: hypothetical protein EA359_15910 [Balneolaceae bacterium]